MSEADTPTAAPRTGPVLPLQGFGPVFTWGLRLNFRPRRLLVYVLLAVGLGALGGVAATYERRFGNEDRYFGVWRTLDLEMLQFVLPVVALTLVGNTFAREVRDRTLVYHLVRPVSRTTVFVARYAAGLVPAALVAMLVLYSTCLFADISLPAEAWFNLAVTGVAAAMVLGAIYYTLAAVFKRGVIAGLTYTFLIEVMLANMPGNIQKLSMRYHIRSIYHGLLDPVFAESSRRVEEISRGEATGPFSVFTQVEYEEPWTALLVVTAIAAGMLLIGGWRVANRDFALKD